jgi:hypothetical protein
MQKAIVQTRRSTVICTTHSTNRHFYNGRIVRTRAHTPSVLDLAAGAQKKDKHFEKLRYRSRLRRMEKSGRVVLCDALSADVF